MGKRPISQIFLFILFVITTVLTVTLIFLKNTTETKPKNIPQENTTRNTSININLPDKSRPLPNQQKYDKTHLVYVLADNSSGSIFSRYAQVRGDVIKWNNQYVTIDTKGERLIIELPTTVRLICYPEVINGQNAKTFAFLFPEERLGMDGVITPKEKISPLFPVGTNMMLAVHVGLNDQMTAALVAGIGCKKD